jgi:DNA-binding transcriptional regulator PaaX
MNKYSKGEVTKVVLKTIAFSAVAVSVVALPGLAVALSLLTPRNKRGSYKLTRTVRRLDKTGFVQINAQGNINLTKRGKQKIKEYGLDDISLKKQPKWDNRWRIIIFDIPESKAGARRALGRKLKELGFFPFQKSTFVFPYHCKDEVDFVCSYFNIHKYLRYIVAQEIQDDKKLREYFKLK